jgi:hypothetical protein
LDNGKVYEDGISLVMCLIETVTKKRKTFLKQGPNPINAVLIYALVPIPWEKNTGRYLRQNQIDLARYYVDQKMNADPYLSMDYTFFRNSL